MGWRAGEEERRDGHRQRIGGYREGKRNKPNIELNIKYVFSVPSAALVKWHPCRVGSYWESLEQWSTVKHSSDRLTDRLTGRQTERLGLPGGRKKMLPAREE